jgi:hypothetical protein
MTLAMPNFKVLSEEELKKPNYLKYGNYPYELETTQMQHKLNSVLDFKWF